ncbi:MAG: hypothetical protein ABIN89_24610 [Chitinophagaceae bacterium]
MADLDQQSPEEKDKLDKKVTQPVKPGDATGNISSGTSIGPGTSDQGFEPGEEYRDDEFRNEKYRETILDKENVHHGNRPTHGLVEEGPGPDS